MVDSDISGIPPLPRKLSPLPDNWLQNLQTRLEQVAEGSSKEAKKPTLSRKKSWKAKHAEMPSPPTELSRDTTKLSLSFKIPVPNTDLKKVLVSGGTDSLTVRDVATGEEDRVEDALYEFVKTQFTAPEEINVLFRLETSATHTLAKTDLELIAQQLVKVSTSIQDFKVRFELECLWLDDDPVVSSAVRRATGLAEKRNIIPIFVACANKEGRPDLFTWTD